MTNKVKHKPNHCKIEFLILKPIVQDLEIK